MAIFAHLFCWAFIAFLLVRDSKRRTSLGAATWIPTVMLFALLTRTPAEWLDQQSAFSNFANDRAGVLIDQLFFAFVIGASLVIGFLRHVKWSRLFAANFPLMLFYLYCLVSVLWSYSPVDSLVRVLKDFGATVLVISLILSEKKPLEALRAVFVRCACVVIPLSALFTRFSTMGKQFARNGDLMYTGAATQKNSLGEMLLICVMFLVWDHMEERSAAGAKRMWSGMKWDRILLLLGAFWLLNLSQSRTSLVSLIIGLTLLVGTGWLATRKASSVLLGVALSYPLLVLLGQKASLLTPVLEMLGRDATFTGRADIWRHITLDTVNPLIGAGFWNFWGGPGGKAIAAIMQTGIPNAHDGYLDVYLDGGLIGVFLLSCVLVTSGRRLIRNLPLHRFYRLSFAFLLVAIVHNVTESSFSRLSAMWFTTLLAMLEFPSLKDKLKSVGARGAVVLNSELPGDNMAETRPQADNLLGVGFRTEVD